jgi:hypothetical protein
VWFLNQGILPRKGTREIHTGFFFFGKFEGKRHFGKPRLRWDDNIKIYFNEIEYQVWTGFD